MKRSPLERCAVAVLAAPAPTECGSNPPRCPPHHCQPVPISANQYQLVLTSASRCQPVQTRANQCQPLPSSTNQCQPMPTSANQCQPVPTNANHRQPLPANANQCQPVPTNATQCQPVPLAPHWAKALQGFVLWWRFVLLLLPFVIVFLSMRI